MPEGNDMPSDDLNLKYTAVIDFTYDDDAQGDQVILATVRAGLQVRLEEGTVLYVTGSYDDLTDWGLGFMSANHVTMGVSDGHAFCELEY